MRGRCIPCSGLGKRDRARMRALMEDHFLGVHGRVFDRDLEDKDYAVMLTDGRGVLRGFTTFALVPAAAEDEGWWVVYSGDTIVDRSARSTFALAQTWIDSIRQLKRRRGIRDLAWLLICSGPRTYRFLPVFFREFFPRAGREAPAAVRDRLHRLAAARYGQAYDAASGIVRLAHPQPLRPELLPQGDRPQGRDVSFFLERNPGHRQGDELACFTVLDDDNLTAAGRRMVLGGKARRRSSAPPVPIGDLRAGLSGG